MKTIRIAAVGDVHSPKYLEMFVEALKGVGEVDLFLFAGDIVLKNDRAQLQTVFSAVREVYGGKILACFGNEEYLQDREKYMEFKEICWIDDDSLTLEVEGLRIGIVGSQGSLARPTFWQRTHIRGIRELYRKRVKIIDESLKKLNSDVKLVLTHYAPTYTTIKGENPKAWPEIGNRKLEEVIMRRQPDLWIHAHAHRASELEVMMGRTLVVNVSLPARKGIYVTGIPRPKGLDSFL